MGGWGDRHLDGQPFRRKQRRRGAQHVLASGHVDARWPLNGVAVSTASGPQEFPAIASDGAGGAIITWFDLRSSMSSFDIYAQHVMSTGVVDPAWPANGRALCLAAGDQLNPTIVSDGVHGAIVTWYDIRDRVNPLCAARARLGRRRRLAGGRPRRVPAVSRSDQSGHHLGRRERRS
jgi:hypothetical protein